MNDSGLGGTTGTSSPGDETTPQAESPDETTAPPSPGAADSSAPDGSAADSPAAGDGAAADSSAADGSAGDEPAGDGSAADGGAARPPASGARRPVTRRRRKRSFWKELPILVAVALLLAVVIKTFALQAFFIPSGSMENTLEVNDRVLINKLVYHFRGIHRGDIVVFDGDGSWDPGSVPSTNPFSEFWSNFASMFGFGHVDDIYIKRVIGLPGDHVACCNAQGQVTVNGVPLSESSYLYPGDAPSLSRFNIVVPPGQLWVMGDHRSVSADSRDHLGDPGGGTIPEKAVLGRAFIIIWPPSRWRILPIPATFQQSALNKASSSANAAAPDPALASVLAARLQPAGPELPLAMGFAGAVPLTWIQYRLRGRVRLRFRRRRHESP
jgi:signal peptidase I